MSVVSEVRCFDCLQEFRGGPRFAVIKEDKSQPYNEEERRLGGHLYQVLVCGDCAGWYDDPVEARNELRRLPLLDDARGDDVYARY